MEKPHPKQGARKILSYISSFSRLKPFFGLCLVLISVAVSFYWTQNSGQLEGGGIALPKLIWLLYAIILWFLIPGIIANNKLIAPHWRTIFKVFLINMLLRGAIELYLMYVTVSWNPYYGIAHDVFSLFLIASLLLYFRKVIHADLYLGYASVVMTTLMIEIGFVFYMINNVQNSSGNSVYFVPNDPSHNLILSITWVVVALLTIYFFELGRRIKWVN